MRLTHRDLYAAFDGLHLTVGSSLFERRWRLDAPRPRPVSLRDKSAATDWLAAPSNVPGVVPPHTTVALSVGRRNIVEAESLQALITCPDGQLQLVLFPDVPGLLLRWTPQPSAAKTDDSAPAADTPATGIEGAAAPVAPTQPAAHDLLDDLPLAARHHELTAVELQDQTDHFDTLAFSRTYHLRPSLRTLSLPGVLFHLDLPEDSHPASPGLTLLKLAALPYTRPWAGPADLVVTGDRLSLVTQSRTEPHEHAVLLHSAAPGGLPRTAALHRLQLALRPNLPGRDGLLLSNTWGDRSQDAAMNAAFIGKELDRAIALGVDVLQLDDGWQTGITANSKLKKGGVWSGFYRNNPDFWTVSAPKFPDGLQPLIARAAQHNIAFGLWFAPDSADHFAHWRRDVDQLLHLHRTLGVRFFKFDGIEITSPTGAANLRALIDALLTESAGQIVVDLDVTASTRPGYFGLPHAGPIFLENRYTDWTNYFPHATLRNLWDLAHHVHPSRLRLEFLNHERNAPKYTPHGTPDPLAPAHYTADYLFAITALASPLAWSELQHLSDTYVRDITSTIAAWKPLRPRLHNVPILPLGQRPTGHAWPAFLTLPPTPQSGNPLLLAFRELTPTPDHTLPLPPHLNIRTATPLFGSSIPITAHPTTAGLSLHAPTPRSFTLFELELS